MSVIVRSLTRLQAGLAAGLRGAEGSRSAGDTAKRLNAFIQQNEPFIKYAAALLSTLVFGMIQFNRLKLNVKDVEKTAAVAHAELEARVANRMLDLAFHGDYDEFRKELDKKIEARAAAAAVNTRATAAADKARAAAAERGASVGNGSAVA